jgi:hypothetical protein
MDEKNLSPDLDRIFMAETIAQGQRLISLGLAEISWRKYHARPGRKSKSPHGKWANKWA